MNNEELRNLLLGNCVNDNGDLVICDIDLSKFKGKVYLTGWKIGGSADLSYWDVKGDLDQGFQKVNGDLEQDFQTAENLWQNCQKVNGDLYQNHQKVGKDLISQKLKEDEEWVDVEGSECAVIRTKKLKEISLDELAKMGYKLKEK